MGSLHWRTISDTSTSVDWFARPEGRSNCGDGESFSRHKHIDSVCIITLTVRRLVGRGRFRTAGLRQKVHSNKGYFNRWSFQFHDFQSKCTCGSTRLGTELNEHFDQFVLFTVTFLICTSLFFEPSFVNE